MQYMTDRVPPLLILSGQTLHDLVPACFVLGLPAMPGYSEALTPQLLEVHLRREELLTGAKPVWR